MEAKDPMGKQTPWWLESYAGEPLSTAAGESWQPAADIYRTPEGWLIKLDLAGVPPSEVEVVLQDNAVLVRGVRRDTQARCGLASYSLEINYYRFERVIRLPTRLESFRVQLESQDGMLLVWLKGRSDG